MSDTLDKIVDRGNRRVDGKRDNWIVCKDGFKLSVVAGPGCYCTPRPALGGIPLYNDDVPENYPGPYAAVEVGYPSEKPEPWHCSAWHDGYDRHDEHPVCDGWQRYADGADWDDFSGVFGYVPVVMVRALIDSHGGEQS